MSLVDAEGSVHEGLLWGDLAEGELAFLPQGVDVGGVSPDCWVRIETPRRPGAMSFYARTTGTSTEGWGLVVPTVIQVVELRHSARTLVLGDLRLRHWAFGDCEVIDISASGVAFRVRDEGTLAPRDPDTAGLLEGCSMRFPVRMHLRAERSCGQRALLIGGRFTRANLELVDWLEAQQGTPRSPAVAEAEAA